VGCEYGVIRTWNATGKGKADSYRTQWVAGMASFIHGTPQVKRKG